VLSHSRQPAAIQEVVAAGAQAFVLKTATPADLVAGIEAVMRGETYLQPTLGVTLFARTRPRRIGPRTAPGS
jgi:DNA-binding NarL/FixJ family response regulator